MNIIAGFMNQNSYSANPRKLTPVIKALKLTLILISALKRDLKVF